MIRRATLVLGFLLVSGLFQCARSQDAVPPTASFTQKGSVVVVTYDLDGEQGETYKVTLLLSTSGGETFDYQPKAVSGAVGKGVTPGPGKKIRWRVLEDFPDGLQSPNVQFKVKAVKQGGSGWLYAIGGVVLAGGGGTAAAILTGLIQLGGGSGGGGDGSGSGSGETIPPLDPNPP